MKKRIMLVLFALALLSALAISLYAAPTEIAELNGIYETAVQMTTDNVFGDTGGRVSGVECPYCQKSVTWRPLPANTSGGALSYSGHYYLAEDLTANTGYYITRSNLCLHLNGHSIKSTNAFAIASSSGYELNVMGEGNVEGTGSKGGGTVYVGGTTRLFGGRYTATDNYYVVSLNAANANLYMYNGTTINGKASATSAIVCANAANLYLYGGTVNVNNGTGFYLSNGTTYLAGTTVNATGGCGVLLADGGTAAVYHSAGSITGAAKHNVHMYAGTYTLSGGTISGGNTTDIGGGNVFVTGTGRFNMTGGEISGGTAPNGGNVYVYAGTFQMEGGTVTKGTANGALSANQYYYNGGGNLYVNDAASAVANISGGTVSDGTATNNSGGNILCRGKGTLNVSGGTVSGGKAGHVGGNIMNGASPNVTISGGIITGGMGDTAGNMPQDGDNIASFGGTLTVSGGTVESDGSTFGDGILAYYNAKIILDGDARVTNTGKRGNIYIAKQSGTATLQVKNTFTGEVGVTFHAEHGLALDATLPLDSSTGHYTGTVYAEELKGLGIVATADNKLAVGSTLVNNVWYQNNKTAMAAVTGDATIKLYSSNDLELKGASYVVDLNGRNVKITGTGSVTCFDSANDNYTANGSATITGVDLANGTMTEVNGKQYVKLVTNGTYTFHRLDMRVNGISFRHVTAGIYYTCTWNCDDTLKNALGSFGVAVSLDEMPVNEASLETCQYTENTMDNFASGVTMNSAIVNNIFAKKGWDEEPNNGERGKMPIYAVPYVRLNNSNGEYLFLGGVSYSLQDVMKVLDTDAYYYNNVKALESFYDTWGAAMSDWGFQNIGQAWGKNPDADGKLQVLMVGDGFSYHYLDELYGMLASAAGDEYKNGIEIYNLYYDGCTLVKHYNWWHDGEAHYQLFKTDSNGCNEVKPTSDTHWTLEQALAQGNWDYISLQEYSGGRFIEAYEDDGAFDEVCADIAASAGPLLGRFHGLFPQAQLLWHRTWAFEVGRKSGDIVYDADMLAKYDAGMQKVSDYMCSEFDKDKTYDLKMVNSGAAWTEARALNAALETSLIPTVGGLCARWGVSNVNSYPAAAGNDNAGDGYHDGDIGGGQLLNAYVWYMALTGDTDLSDNAYVPSYFRTSAALVSLLKEAAEKTSGSAGGSGNLQIGYGRVDITPDHLDEYPVYLWTSDWQNHPTQTVKDDLYVTCVAIRNGKETVLLYSLDMLSVYDSFADPAKAAISSATGVPQENILLNATHTHSSVAIIRPWDGVEQYRQEFYQAVVEAAEDAIADLSAANTYAGGTQTEHIAFVRHYYNKAGGVCGSNFGSSTSGYASHVREADEELQLVRFERAGKKDVLLMSFPAHATFFEAGDEISADYPGYVRSYVEKNNEDMLVAVFQGASGDQNPTSRITGETDITDCQLYGEALGQYALDALSGLKKLQNSEVKLSTKTFVGYTNTNGADQLAGAREVVDLVVNQGYTAGSSTVKTLYKKYGFTTYTEALWVTYRADYYNTLTQQMDLRVLSIGDELGFAIAPYEMFGENGMQLKEQSPFETTVIITHSEGAMSYLPNEESCDYSSYEYHVSLFEKGTAETLVTEFADMLDQLKGA